MKKVFYRVVFFLVISFFPLSDTAHADPFSVLFRFGTDSGWNPNGSLIINNGALYGTASQGYYGSTIFSIPLGGGNFSVMHTFAGAPSDGSSPDADLLISGSDFVGMTDSGGTNDKGTIFSIPTGGGTVTIRKSFSGGTGDGLYPSGNLIQSSSDRLYGMTPYGGKGSPTYWRGTLFSIKNDYTGYSIIRKFDTSDGIWPMGSLVYTNGYFYGMTSGGGASSSGTIFSLKESDNTFSVMCSFNSANGRAPEGSLILSGDNSTLYGMTTYGGNNDFGTIFSIGTGGGAPSVLYTFDNTAASGTMPYGSLLLYNGDLYGMTSSGTSSLGILFSIGTAPGSSLSILHVFNGGANDGAYPKGSLVRDGNILYGTTYSGGPADDFGEHGVIFSYTLVPEPSAVGLLGIGLVSLLALMFKSRGRRG